MSPNQQVIHLLRGPTAARIRFKTPAFTVDRRVFLRVAEEIEKGNVVVQVGAEIPASARYLNDIRIALVLPFLGGVSLPVRPNTIQLAAPISGRAWEGVALHQCAHAFFDIAKASIGAQDEEAIGLLISVLYARMTGMARSRWDRRDHPNHLAGKVADKLLHAYAVGSHTIPAVDDALFLVLKFAIRIHPNYRGEPPATRGASFPHDG